VDAWAETEEKMTNKALVPIDNRLAKHADRIRGLMTDLARNSIELGVELTEAHKHFKSLPIKLRPSRSWKQWLNDQFNIRQAWAYTLIKAAKAKNGPAYIKKASPHVIALITSTPSSPGVEEIKHRLKKGENISREKAQAIIRKHKKGVDVKLPSPHEARIIAAKTNSIIAASDGRLYTGASEEAVKLAEDRRTIVYGVREALGNLANVAAKMTPKAFLEFASPHQLWREGEDEDLQTALDWLSDLVTQWNKREKHNGSQPTINTSM
jgi:hypothetical protein